MKEKTTSLFITRASLPPPAVPAPQENPSSVSASLPRFADRHTLCDMMLAETYVSRRSLETVGYSRNDNKSFCETGTNGLRALTSPSSTKPMDMPPL
jgi:hypothetical protein